MSDEVLLKGFKKMKASEHRIWISDIDSGAVKILPEPVDEEVANGLSEPVEDEQTGESAEEETWEDAEVEAEEPPMATQGGG